MPDDTVTDRDPRGWHELVESICVRRVVAGYSFDDKPVAEWRR